MGLDIYAVSHLRFLRPMPKGEERDQLEQQFADQGKEIGDVYFFLYPNGSAHKARLDGMKPGLYEYTERSERHSFRAGSYSGYNSWRRQLALFAHEVPPEEIWEHPRRYRAEPFVEVIDFTDCDGRIGTKIAAKLAADFRDHRKLAADFATTLEANEGEYWIEVYDEFATAFALAAQDGALEFC